MGNSFPTINYYKLTKYVKVLFKARHREFKNGNIVEKYYTTNFRNCKYKDFEINGYHTEDQGIKDELERRFCPRMEDVED